MIPVQSAFSRSHQKSRTFRPDLVPQFLTKLYASDEQSLALEEHTRNRPDLAQALVADALKARASDIHLEPHPSETRVRLRIDGQVLDTVNLTRPQAKSLINQFKTIANLDPIVRFAPKDSHARILLNDRAVDLRLALAPCQGGEALTLRLLDPNHLELLMTDLGLTDRALNQLEEWLENVNGMILAAGPTGSGKTTTMYALLHELKFGDRTIVSLEDPIEYEVPGIAQMQLDEKHHLTFAEGIKSMLRLDPDFLMIGEIRDETSAQAAVDAAITGRVLLSTIHSRDAVGAVNALRNWGLADHQIAESLSVVAAQRLVRKLCPACRKSSRATEIELRWLQSLGIPPPQSCWTAVGCKECHHLGYVGRTGVFELWRLQDSDYELILGHGTEHALRTHLAQRRHTTFLEDAFNKVRKGLTSLAEVRKAAGSTAQATPFVRTHSITSETVVGEREAVHV
jgi:general secretion pathway protein E